MPRKEKPVRVERGLYRAGKTFLACATPPGSRTPRWRTIGDVGLMEARVARDAWVTKVKAGHAPRVEKATVREVAGAWLEHIQDRVDTGDLSERTKESYENGVNLHLLKTALGNRPVASVTVDDLVGWHRDQRATGASKWSIRARWMAVRGVFAFAARKGWITVSPADQLLSEERPKPGDPNHRYLSREEIKTLIGAAGADEALIAMGVFTGMRVSEILGLVWGDVDFVAAEIHVRFQMGRKGERVKLKTRAARRDVILMPALARLLRRRRIEMKRSTDMDLLFQSGTGRTMGYWVLQDKFEATATTAGVEGVTPHAMRHTFASILISEGRSVEFVSRQLGHAHTSTTLDTYSHLFDARRHAEEARDGLEAGFGAMLGTKKGLSA
jgi:integrase